MTHSPSAPGYLLSENNKLTALSKLLVCAPSNGAVDELAQRLALEGGGVWDHRGKAFAPRVIRVGTPSEGAADRVKAVSLNFMVEERLAKPVCADVTLDISLPPPPFLHF